jgi:ribosomal protein S17|uniref:Ribosomal protein S17 n=1 Tax=Panagrolaimus davidi TaxID=227884 RepID=A0A914PK91_9BILA
MATKIAKDLLLGKVVQINKIGLKQIPCALVRCQENIFNSHIKKYFAESKDYWALDHKNKSNVGDHVLIKKAEKSERPTSSVEHTVERVVFQYGNLIDPITKKRVLNEKKYLDEALLEQSLVKEIVEEPFAEDALLFDERRSVQKEKLQEKSAEVFQK